MNNEEDYIANGAMENDDPFVPKEEKEKRVEKSMNKKELEDENKALKKEYNELIKLIKTEEDYKKFKLDSDYKLRHEVGLGTAQIKKLWQLIDRFILE